MSVMSRIGDRCVVLAVQSIQEIVDAFEEETSRKPTVAELAEILTWGARGNSNDLISDGPNRGVSFKGSCASHKRVKLKAGDVVGVPHALGRWVGVVFLGKFSKFGLGFGVSARAEVLSTIADNQDWQPQDNLPYAVFLDNEPIDEGRWPVVSHCPDPIAKFPEPTLYYSAEDGYGKYGKAESMTHEVRDLTEREAESVFGSEPKPFRQVFSERAFEEFIRKRIQAAGDRN